MLAAGVDDNVLDVFLAHIRGWNPLPASLAPSRTQKTEYEEAAKCQLFAVHVSISLDFERPSYVLQPA